MFFKDLGLGFKTFFKAIGFLFSNGLWWFYFIPFVISIFLSMGSWFAIDWVVEQARIFTEQQLGLEPNDDISLQGWDAFVESTKAFINGARDLILIIMLKVIFWYLFFKVNKYVVLIVLSPVMAYLSERTEEILTNKHYPFDILQFTREVWRGILIALRNMFIEITLVVVCWLVTFFMPYISPFTAIFLFFVGAYYYGFSMMDYVNERRRWNIRQSVRYIRLNKGVATGIGTLFALLMWIPFLGFIIAPITASCAAVIAIHEKGELTSEFARPKVIEA